jgi:tetratricopeptide (TPR) repeat protein
VTPILLAAVALLATDTPTTAGARKVAAVVARALPEPAAAREEARRCEEGEGSEDGGLAACREALRLGLAEPRRTAVRQIFARRLADRELFVELVDLYQQDTQEHPGEGEAWRRLGAARLFLRADPAGALPALEEAVRLRSEDADTHVLLGLCLSGLGRHEEAVAAFTEALRLDPEALELRPAAKAALEAARRGQGWP